MVWNFSTLGDSMYHNLGGYWKWFCLPYTQNFKNKVMMVWVCVIHTSNISNIPTPSPIHLLAFWTLTSISFHFNSHQHSLTYHGTKIKFKLNPFMSIQFVFKFSHMVFDCHKIVGLSCNMNKIWPHILTLITTF